MYGRWCQLVNRFAAQPWVVPAMQVICIDPNSRRLTLISDTLSLNPWTATQWICQTCQR